MALLLALSPLGCTGGPEPDRVARGPVAFVETHEVAPSGRDHAPIASERDDEIIARLRALGYLDSPGAVD